MWLDWMLCCVCVALSEMSLNFVVQFVSSVFCFDFSLIYFDVEMWLRFLDECLQC